MKKLLFLLPLMAAALLWHSCKKDSDTTQTGTLVTANFRGFITDESDEPIADVIIRIGTSTTKTDENGIFILKNQEVNSERALITATKIGYFNGSRLVTATEGAQKIVKIQLLKQEVTSTFQSSSGGTATLSSGAKITLPANGVRLADGGTYSGTIQVAAKHLDPSDPNMALQMPGALRGIDGNGDEKALASFGMVVVELTGGQGQQLQIASGSEAEINLPIPASMMAAAPATIPLWHFDEADGLWVEEGSAVKTGNAYIGKVTHFSFWNCDAPFPVVQLTGRVLIDSAFGSGVRVNLTILSNGYSASAFPGADGIFEGKVPANEVMKLDIGDDCGDVIYTANIGPFSSDVVLNDIIINSTNTSYVHISGNLVNCTGNPVTSGYIHFTGSTNFVFNTFFTDATGHFDGVVMLCSNPTSTYTAFDISAGKQSPAGGINNLPSTQNLGTITVCDNLVEYIEYTLDGGQPVTLVGGFASMDGDWFYVSNSQTPGAPDFNIQTYLPVPDVGNYTLSDFLSVGGFTAIDSLPASQAIFVNHNITQWGNVGQPVLGNFDGNFTDWSGTNHTLNGSYRLTRSN